MSPDWTSGDLFGLRTPMYALWVTVSNIVYFIYAILLILIALGTMFGQDKFSYKVMLPKLALGILMVPFTWWFVQWTISIATVVTASVITIPAETMNSDTQKNGAWWTKESIPTLIVISETGTG
jgi:phosphoglycerol transferase MdoB-like AlkP superfamily enzyme